MNISGQQELIVESSEVRKDGYAALCQLAVSCILTKSDRRALAEHILRADKIGTGAFEMPVSYTHLDVYKRQALGPSAHLEPD